MTIMKTIVNKSLNAQDKIDLVEYFRTALNQMMNGLTDEDLEFYKQCNMHEAFQEWQEIHEEGEYLGQGLKLADKVLILNDSTNEAFEECFNEAIEKEIESL